MTDEPEVTEKPPPLVDRGQARDVFIDGYQGVSITNGVAKFNVFSTRLNPTTGKAERVIVCHLAMALPTLISVHKAFGTLLHDLQEQGIIAPPEVSTDEKG